MQGDSLQNRDKLDSPYSVNGELTLASTQLSLDTSVNNSLTLEGIIEQEPAADAAKDIPGLGQVKNDIEVK